MGVADNELVCPMPGCGAEITVMQVEGAMTGTALWEKFLQFRMNLWVPSSTDGAIVECPTPGCGKFVVPRGMEFAACPVCKREFCPKCGLDKHEGSTCEAYRAWLNENSNAERHFEELMAQEQWKRCPVCSAPSERESGCNFMQCRSATCRKKTYWCYVCGKNLPKAEHYAHYPRGPYEDECNNGKVLDGPPRKDPPPRPDDAHMNPADPGAVVGRALDDGIGAIRGWLGGIGAV